MPEFKATVICFISSASWPQREEEELGEDPATGSLPNFLLIEPLGGCGRQATVGNEEMEKEGGDELPAMCLVGGVVSDVSPEGMFCWERR